MSIYDARPWLKSYDAHVPADIEIPAVTYTALLEEGLTAQPQRAAAQFLGRTVTFAELDRLSAHFAAFLAAGGYGPGDVVGINLPNTPQYLIALAGALRAGCAVTGISALLTAEEIAYQVNDADARVLVTLDALFAPKVAPAADRTPRLDHVVATNIADLLPWPKRFLGRLLKKIPSGPVTDLTGKSVHRLIPLLHQQTGQRPRVSLDLAAPCLIQYTGGTTGPPKGAVLTQGNMGAHLTQLKQWLRFGLGEEVFCSAFPFFHQAGLILCLTALRTANTQCLIPDPRNTANICREIATHRPTILANVPTLYQMLLDTPDFRQLDFSSVRLCLSGAAPFAVESIKALEALTGRGTVLEVYGMTESSPMLTMNPLEGEKRIGTVGLPICNTHLKLVDVESGTREVPLGEEGEIIARGPQIMKGYHNRPDESAHAMRDFDGQNWFFTGDVGRMDADGYLTIADRVKDMLIVGGYKVFSREVEEKLYQHPAVEMCAIVGLPNPDRPGSDIVKAVIQPAADWQQRPAGELQADIIAYCKAHMAPYKVPKIVEVCGAIPLTNVGKVDKKQIRGIKD